MRKPSVMRSAMKFRRVATDALFALALFVFVAAATTSPDSSAAGGFKAADFSGPFTTPGAAAGAPRFDPPRSSAMLTVVALPDAPQHSVAMFRRVPQAPALVVLAAVFAALAAANLAFLRHLRRVSAARPGR